MFKVNNKDTRTTPGVILVFLFLTLNLFHSSIDIEVIRTVFFFFLLTYFAQIKNTQALFKYLNAPKKA